MAFPVSAVFEGLKGLVHVTVTADAAGEPELVHLADEAGHACAHFAIHEWDLLGEHIAAMLHTELHGTPQPAVLENAGPVSRRTSDTVNVGGSLTDPAVTPTSPFLPPEQPAEQPAEAGVPDASDHEGAATSPAGEDQQA